MLHLLNRTTTLASLLVGACLIFVGTAALADDLPLPAGKTILVISGAITATNKDGSAEFDRAMLESLGAVAITTITPWYDAPVTFEGISLDALMKRVGADGEKVTAVALNDYSTEIPLSDFAEHGAVLALKRDGEYMTVRDKGPLFIVYPYDSDRQLQSQTYYNRSAWQLAKLVVE
ncbi:molybdopterin-dependent oxidoreductase [Aureimonas glaciei]|uniref:Oxidoreductase n=1 Tax=Aureimonas glaciei TaxID=1776957 RepID=A0A916Y3B6_9HYPH|nr:molybdopterin-dependent oxidoreductase [Aureimonas glaciei]GGD28699.1 oxidoreductase [Aureimonas glaciei]